MSEDNAPSVLKFLTELCLLCDPRTVSDSIVNATPTTSFVLDLHPLSSRTPNPAKKKLPQRRARVGAISQDSGSVKIVSMLIGYLEAGLAELKRRVSHKDGRREGGEGAEEGEELQMLWCSLVCLQYVRYASEDLEI